MKTFAGLVVMGSIMMTLMVAAAVRLFVELSPYLLAGAVAFAVVRGRRRRPQRPPFTSPRPFPQPARPVAPAPSGWVLVPVWIGPGQRRPTVVDPIVIDAEVIDDGRGGT